MRIAKHLYLLFALSGCVVAPDPYYNAYNGPAYAAAPNYVYGFYDAPYPYYYGYQRNYNWGYWHRDQNGRAGGTHWGGHWEHGAHAEHDTERHR